MIPNRKWWGAANALLEKASDADLRVLVGMVLAEIVSRGSDHDTALSHVVQAAVGGFDGSKQFDAAEGGS